MKRSLIEEIERINKINEYNYDFDDVSRQTPSKQIHPADLGGKKDAVNKWLSRHEDEVLKKEKSERYKMLRKSHPLDINNHKDRMVIFRYLSKHHNINNATEESLKTIRRLRDKQSYAHVPLSIDDEFELEYGYYLLISKKYGFDKWGHGTGFDGLHLSPTFNSILNITQNGFKKGADPSYEDFKKFMMQNKNVFEKEITDFIKNKKE